MPIDRASILREVLTRLYPALENAPAYLERRAPGLYDRLIGGREDARSFQELATLIPLFEGELTRYLSGRPARPDMPADKIWELTVGMNPKAASLPPRLADRDRDRRARGDHS